jgi:hypothetical protein
MNPDLEVDVVELRRTACAIAETATRVTAGARRKPVAGTTPRWAATDAALLAAGTARQQLATLGADIADTARQISAAVEAYEIADARAANRLRLTR